jgi:prolyl oligopeptidase
MGPKMSRFIELPPFTPVEPTTEILHGIEIADPYRWLEDQNSFATRRWIDGQTGYTRAYFSTLAGRDNARKRVAELLSPPSVTDFWNAGNRYFFLKRCMGGEQPAIAMREGLFGKETILVEPARRNTGPSTAVAIMSVSEDGRFVAYSVRQAGTDHCAIEIVDTDRGIALPDRLTEGFYTGFAFASNGTGFHYAHHPLDDPRPNYCAVFRHEFGTDGSIDQEVLFAGKETNLFLGILHSSEAKMFAYPAYFAGKSPRTCVYINSEERDALPRILLRDIEGCFIPFFARGEFFAFTDFAAPNFRIVRIDIDNPDPSQWQDVVSESDLRIQQFAVAGDRIFVTRTVRFSTRLEGFATDGAQKDSIPLPDYCSVDLMNSAPATEKLLYRQTSVSKPYALYCYEVGEQNVLAVEDPHVPFDSSSISVEDVLYTSKDGTAVPLFLAARKDLLHSGPLPTFLTGYGGFGGCVTPRFTVFASFLMELGVLFAVPAVRGGSELGEQWHMAGKREKRQNSFDDFVAAAEWLISEGRSERDRIAIGGGSNAGLLVGAVITQRPDLFRAAICLGPLLDMTRYHLFDFAGGWADEYGSPDDPQDFHSLLSYSPYHSVRNGTMYPAVLLISGDADTRCNPMHTRKMTARLQGATTSGHPILLDYGSEWGHTPVQPLSKRIAALTDRLAFLCHELGIRIRPGELPDAVL